MHSSYMAMIMYINMYVYVSVLFIDCSTYLYTCIDLYIQSLLTLNNSVGCCYTEIFHGLAENG